MTQLSKRLRDQRILIAPGVFDTLSAVIAEHHGCEAVFVSGAAVSMTQLALPDVGLVSVSELTEVVARIADRVEIPIFVDGDSGYGNAANLQRLVRNLCRAGASAVQIEDQVAIKPPGQLRQRPLVSVNEMVGKIKAAQDARFSEGFLISARTDAITTAGIDEAIARGHAYVDAGCDLLFIESVAHAEDISRIIDHFGGSVKLVHNLLEGGASPFADAHEVEAAGFSLALFPATALHCSVQAMGTAYAEIVASASASALRGTIASIKDINEIIGADEFVARIASYGEEA